MQASEQPARGAQKRSSDRRTSKTLWMVSAQAEFLKLVLSNSKNRAILDRASSLGLPDWWLTEGAVFQTVWNVLERRPAENGILDYDLFYFDGGDLTAEAETRVNRAAGAGALFADLVVHPSSPLG